MYTPFIAGNVPVLQPKRSFKNTVQMHLMWAKHRYAVFKGYYSMDGKPLRCEQCDSWHWSDHRDVITDRIDWTPCELRKECKRCGHVMGYWAYGYWEPPYI